MAELRIIVGLGNPGKDYEFTRHNLGFLVVRYLAEKLKIKFSLSSFTNGLVAEGKDYYDGLLFLMPLTYVNNSGVAVKQMMKTKNIGLDHVLIVCDDINLDFSNIRLKAKGSDGGHNGLHSIIEQLQTQTIARLRLGVGRPKSKDEVVDYVLSDFKKSERNKLDDFIIEAADCCLTWLKTGTQKTMEQSNRRKKNGN